jgi:hypothetical protein
MRPWGEAPVLAIATLKTKRKSEQLAEQPMFTKSQHWRSWLLEEKAQGAEQDVNEGEGLFCYPQLFKGFGLRKK